MIRMRVYAKQAEIRMGALTSFRGPQGPKGDRGDKGDTGEKGEPGYTPVKGVDYFDGEDGHTPVKGVDYWTAEDQAAIDEAREGEGNPSPENVRPIVGSLGAEGGI